MEHNQWIGKWATILIMTGVSTWYGWPEQYRVLFLMMAANLGLWCIATFVQKRAGYDAFWTITARKIGVWIIIFALSLLQSLNKIEAMKDVDFVASVTYLFIFMEVFNLMENAGAAGIKIPAMLANFMKKLQALNDADQTKEKEEKQDQAIQIQLDDRAQARAASTRMAEARDAVPVGVPVVVSAPNTIEVKVTSVPASSVATPAPTPPTAPTGEW